MFKGRFIGKSLLIGKFTGPKERSQGSHQMEGVKGQEEENEKACTGRERENAEGEKDREQNIWII